MAKDESLSAANVNTTPTGSTNGNSGANKTPGDTFTGTTLVTSTNNWYSGWDQEFD